MQRPLPAKGVSAMSSSPTTNSKPQCMQDTNGPDRCNRLSPGNGEAANSIIMSADQTALQGARLRCVARNPTLKDEYDGCHATTQCRHGRARASPGPHTGN